MNDAKKYLSSPDEYLEANLKIMPEAVKWYLQVFQTIFLAAIVGAVAFLFYLGINKLLEWLTNPLLNTAYWIIPLFLAAIIIFFAPKISDFIQRHYKITYNLKEIQIEIYYISKIIQIRKKIKSLEILKLRLAKGEITPEDYERLKKLLEE